MAAAIPEAMALMRGSIVMTDELEGAAVTGKSGQEASGASCSSAAAYQSTGLCCLSRSLSQVHSFAQRSSSPALRNPAEENHLKGSG
jgi:hypothetical protein